MAMFSANEAINTIVTHLNANGFTAHNHFGWETSDFDKLLQQVGHIYVFYKRHSATPESCGSTRNILYIDFWMIDQVMGANSTKNDYLIDTFRAYIGSGTWKDLGLCTQYPNDNFEKFDIEDEYCQVIYETDEKGKTVLTGKTIGIFLTSIKFHMSGRTV